MDASAWEQVLLQDCDIVPVVCPVIRKEVSEFFLRHLLQIHAGV